MSSVPDLRSVKFPSVRYPNAGSYFDAYLDESYRAGRSIDPLELERAAAVLVDAYTRSASVFTCGNGGSASIANHMGCDHVKGVRTKTDLCPRVVSLSSNVELLTAIANDVTYDDVFVYQLQSHAAPGDVLVAVSSSGSSENIVRALSWARDHDLRTIALTGFDGGTARTTAEVVIHVDCSNYGIVEDLHQGVMHTLAQYIRHSRMTATAVSSIVF